MKQPPLKFRAWDYKNSCFFYSESYACLSKFFDCMEGLRFSGVKVNIQPWNGDHYDQRDVYPGDIFSMGEPGEVPELVIYTFIEETFQFEYLKLPGEYAAYLQKGVDGIEETEYFDDDTEEIIYKGNVFENPELVK